jgi:pentatricopeptide repeat protein
MRVRIFVFILLASCDFASSRLDSEIQNIADSNRKNPGPAFMDLLRQYQNFPDDAWYVFQNINQPNIRHYTKTITICKRNPRRVQYLLNELKEKGIEPDVIIYSTALNAFKKDFEEFRRIWKEMKEKGIEPDRITYSTALNAFKGDVEEFRRIWKEMTEKGIEPDVFTYNTALNAFKNFDDFGRK